MSLKISKGELKNILIVSIVLGFIISFREWGDTTFNASVGLTNWFFSILIGIFSILSRSYAYKLISYKNGAKATITKWTIDRMGFSKGAHLPMKTGLFTIQKYPAWIIFPIIFSFVTLGYLKVLSLLSVSIEEIKKHRIGHKFSNLKEFEEGKILSFGILSSILLASIFKVISSFAPLSPKFISVNYLLALGSLIPISKIDGCKIFAGSRPLFFSTSLFVLLSSLILAQGNTTSGLIIFLVTSIALTLLYFKKD